MFLKILSVLMLLSLASFLQGCEGSAAEAPAPSPIAHSSAASEVRWPRDQLKQNASGVPLLDVYVLADEKVETMDMETYLQGVLAGEMKNDWPMEALKAQAILARTFVLKFVDEKESRYEGAQISTDIEEAQAYDAASITTVSGRPLPRQRAWCCLPAESCPMRGSMPTAEVGQNWPSQAWDGMTTNPLILTPSLETNRKAFQMRQTKLPCGMRSAGRQYSPMLNSKPPVLHLGWRPA